MYSEGINDNFLLCAASGQGKTHMAIEICKYLTDDEPFQTMLGRIDTFDPSVRVHFIDEAHIIREFEPLYPIMDSGEYVIVLATNEYTKLPEPVVNRCNNSGFVFTPYTDRELYEIIKISSETVYDEDHLQYLIKSGGHNPRVIKGIVTNLDVYFKYYPFPRTIREFKQIIKDTFGIVDGISPIAANYLEALQALGGRASLALLAGTLRIDKSTLQGAVEPLLLNNSLIRITSKGRELC